MPPQSWANSRDYEAPAPLKAPDQPVPFWSAVNRNMIDAGQTRRAGAREEAYMARMWDRHREAERITGQKLPLSDTLNGEPTDQRDSLKRFMDRVLPVDRLNAAILGRPGVLSDDEYEARIEQLRAENPEGFASVRTRSELLARLDEDLRGIRARADQAAQGGIGNAAAGLLGQTVGAFASDPGQIGVAVVTGGWGAGRPLLTRMAAQGAANAGAEALEIGGRTSDAALYGGPEYTAGEAAADVGFAAGGGAGFEVLGDVGKAAFRATARRLATSAEPGERGVADQIERLLIDEEVLANADDFDAARAALARGEPRPSVEPEQSLDDLFANQPDAPVLRGVAASQPEATGGLTSAEYMGRTIWSGRFDPMQVEADAARFQYKADGDADGVTGRLRGVERWDATASGKAILFQDTDGRMFVADGHQRRGLARRLAEQGWEDARLDGYLFKASDGWTAREVRVVAALKNIREGSGAIMDAAKLFREAPGALKDRSLPVTGDFIHQARQLASLSEPAFRAVVNGVIPERYGAVLGEVAGDRPELQADLVDLLRRGEPGSIDGARALVHEALLDDFIASEGVQMDLFGGLPRESTVIARGRIREAVMRSLRKDERTFAALVRNADAVEAGGNVLARSDNEARLALDRAAQELVSKLSLRSGEIGEAFSEAAAAVTRGEVQPGAAAKGLTARIRNAVKAGDLLELERKALIDPAAPSPQGVKAAAAFDQPGGRAQAAQIEPKPEDADLEEGRPVVARLSGDEIALTGDRGEDVRNLTLWLKSTFGGQTVQSEALGRPVRITSSGLDKTARVAAPEVMRAAPAIGAVLEKGRLIASEPDTRGRSNVRAYHTLQATVEIGGERLNVVAKVREQTDGSIYWGLFRDDGRLDASGQAQPISRGQVETGGGDDRAANIGETNADLNLSVEPAEPGPPPGLFDDLPEATAEDRALSVLKACAPGRA